MSNAPFDNFDNSMIAQKRPNKPHIQMMWGYWRVSEANPRKSSRLLSRWNDAHQFAGTLNSRPIRIDWHADRKAIVVHYVGGRSYYYYLKSYADARHYIEQHIGMICRRWLGLSENPSYASWSKVWYVY